MNDAKESGSVVALQRRAIDRARELAVNDDLRALIQAEQSARKRDQEIYDRALDDLRRELATVKSRYDKLVARVLVASGAIVTLIYLLNWIGPTVVRRLIDAIAGTGP